ncbi:DUF2098 domain-containing protein [Methanobrevibacter filiformis]|uniref:DUF2098 domain-containing protein n=1 Tax=Methanobrevibacter filiformis TaxID=55758 RepID=A0A166CK80_9EURY|nr:DUF2098 family protein [Methanobrevibacter filiformis]KZX14596.1 hypothetical protein MBFIL_08360 [Methanobrevibacter filiformis]
MDAHDSHGKLINIGSVVRYNGTGTIGKSLDIKFEDDIYWIKLDKTNLWYDSSTLELIGDDISDENNIHDEDNSNSEQAEDDDVVDKTKNLREGFETIEMDTNVGEGGG